MPSDALLNQTAPVGAQTATWHSSGSTLSTFGKGPIFTDVFYRVIYSALQNSSGANSWTLTSELSIDNGTSWSTLSGLPPITCSTTPQSGEAYLELPLNSPLLSPTMTNNPLIRVSGTLSGAGAGATMTVSGIDFVPARL